MPGPPPKHPSVRARKNNPRAEFRSLPRTGRKGKTPAWPLPRDVAMTALLDVQRDRAANLQVQIDGTEDGRARGRLQRALNRREIASAQLALQIELAEDAEKALWSDLWSTPQAVIWEESHSQREVAQYVRWKIRAEQGDLKAAPEARQLSDRLGLNPLALMRLRAELERVDEVEDQGKRRRSAPTPQRQPAARGKKKPDDPRDVLRLVQ